MFFFNDAANSSDYIVSHDGMSSERRIAEDVKGSNRGLVSGNFPAYTWQD
jgi:hypothetical protein